MQLSVNWATIPGNGCRHTHCHTGRALVKPSFFTPQSHHRHLNPIHQNQFPAHSTRRPADSTSRVPQTHKHQVQKQQVDDAGPAVLEANVHNTGNSTHDKDGHQNDDQPHFIKFLSRLKAPAWIVALWARVTARDADGRPTLAAIHLARMLFIAVCFVVAALGRYMFMAHQSSKPREVMYSEFVTLLDSGSVRSARIESGKDSIYFDVKPVLSQARSANTAAHAASPDAYGADTAASLAGAAPSSRGAWRARATSSTAKVPAPAAPIPFKGQFFVQLDGSDPMLVHHVVSTGVEFSVIKPSFFASVRKIFVSTMSIWLPMAPLILLARRFMGDQGSPRKTVEFQNTPEITFKDVAGVDGAKIELMEVVSVMKTQRAAYSKLRVKMPSGVLLCGPPGTGKTLLAKAVAGEAGVPFIAVSASEFVEMFVGRGAARMRELFSEARKMAPCVVFIDELDAVGSRRGMGFNDERDQTLNQLLTELDGFEGRQGILFLAATNRIDVLDPALLRPGRINRKVVVPLPDEKGRKDILAVHMRSTPMAGGPSEKEEACDRVAKFTNGFSGAELANVVNEASLLAARMNQDHVTIRDLLEGAQRTKFGVNGRASGGPLQGFQSWLMDLAARPDASSRKVKTAMN